MSHKTRTRQGATFASEAYKESGGNLDGYTLIKQNANNKAYKNNVNGSIHVGIKGTSNLSDIVTDVRHAVGVNISTTDRYKDSKTFLEDLKRQNPTANLNIYGHSLGGLIVNKIAKNEPQLISSGQAFNPYALKTSDLDSGGKVTNYRTKTDVASALGSINNSNVESVGSIFDITKSITENHSLRNFYKNGGKMKLMPIEKKLLSY